MSDDQLLDVCHLRLIYIGIGLYGIVRKKGYYDTSSTSTNSHYNVAQKGGRPKKTVPDPHGYRKFGYHETLIRSHSSARFCFELSGNSNYIIHCNSNYAQKFELEINSI